MIDAAYMSIYFYTMIFFKHNSNYCETNYKKLS